MPNTSKVCGLWQEGIFTMTFRTIAPYRRAFTDVHDIICYSLEQTGTTVAKNFASEIDEAYFCGLVTGSCFDHF